MSAWRLQNGPPIPPEHHHASDPPEPQALHLVGIALRTHNGEAFETIPPHWAAFGQAQLAGRLPHRLSDDVYAVYTNFENAGIDNSGRYTLVIGHAVPGHWAWLPPEGLTHVVAPASLRAVFPVDKAGSTKWGPNGKASGSAPT